MQNNKPIDEKTPVAPATAQTMESFKHDFNALISTRQFQAEFLRAASRVLEMRELSASLYPASPYSK